VNEWMTTGSGARNRQNPAGMDCGIARERSPPSSTVRRCRVPRGTWTVHLAGCHACRQWRESAHLVTGTPPDAGVVGTRQHRTHSGGRPGGPPFHQPHPHRSAGARRAGGNGSRPHGDHRSRADRPGRSRCPCRRRGTRRFNLTLAAALLAAAARPSGPGDAAVGAWRRFLMLIDLWTPPAATHAARETPHLITVVGPCFWHCCQGRAGAPTTRRSVRCAADPAAHVPAMPAAAGPRAVRAATGTQPRLEHAHSARVGAAMPPRTMTPRKTTPARRIA